MNTASAIAVDAAGDIYVAGVSTSAGTYTLVVTAKSGSTTQTQNLTPTVQ
jgi:hypothetical protein